MPNDEMPMQVHTVDLPITLAPSCNSSPTLGKIAKALAAAQGEIRHAATDSTNPHFHSSYADLASVYDACRPLAKHGIAVTQLTGREDRAVSVTTVLLHESGEWISTTLSAEVAKADSQPIGSALTYLRRYTLASIAGISPAPGEDDDGERAMGRGGARPTHAAPPAHDASDAAMVTKGQLALVKKSCKQAGVTPEAYREYLGTMGIENETGLRVTQLNTVMEWVSGHASS